MTIKEIWDGRTLTLAMDGRVDTKTAPELEITLTRLLSGADRVIFDFENLEYISSAGLRVLLFAQRAMKDKGGIAIRKPKPIVQEVFHITGFDEVLTIVE